MGNIRKAGLPEGLKLLWRCSKISAGNNETSVDLCNLSQILYIVYFLFCFRALGQIEKEI